MAIWSLADLPAPPTGKTGYPWTEGCAPPPPDARPWPKISVITPSYNQGDFLEETLRSVLLQGYPNLEYIVIDGGSHDQSRAILERYAPYLTYWVSERDNGQADAINKGLWRATGAVMGWLNSDDLLMPGALQTIGAAYRDNPRLMVTCGLRYWLDEASHITHHWTRGLPHPHALRHRNLLAQETVYWRREVWERLGELDVTLRFCMDYDYWLRMLEAGYSIRLLAHYIGGFRLHESSKTMSWEAIYKQELNLLFRRYKVATNEAEAVQKAGVLWRWRYDLTKDLCHQTWFHPPGRALVILHLLTLPVLSWPILAAYGMLKWWRGKP